VTRADLCACCEQNRVELRCPLCNRGYCAVCAEEGMWDYVLDICERCATAE
jgi:hypothetical protein